MVVIEIPCLTAEVWILFGKGLQLNLLYGIKYCSVFLFILHSHVPCISMLPFCQLTQCSSPFKKLFYNAIYMTQKVSWGRKGGK